MWRRRSWWAWVCSGTSAEVTPELAPARSLADPQRHLPTDDPVGEAPGAVGILAQSIEQIVHAHFRIGEAGVRLLDGELNSGRFQGVGFAATDAQIRPDMPGFAHRANAA